MSDVNESSLFFDVENKFKEDCNMVLKALQPASGYVFSKVLDEASKSFKLYSARTPEKWINYLKNECNQLENQLDVIAPRKALAIKQQLKNDFFKSKNEEMALINKVVYLKFMAALYQTDKSNAKEFAWWFEILDYINQIEEQKRMEKKYDRIINNKISKSSKNIRRENIRTLFLEPLHK